MATTTQITQDIQVEVESQYLAEESDPQHSYYFFTYTIKISNQSKRTVQLLSRHWIITDSMGRNEEVIGEGVVGKQPVLAPGEAFTYTSACPLPTTAGTMEGTYTMTDEKGRSFKVSIPLFHLRIVNLLH